MIILYIFFKPPLLQICLVCFFSPSARLNAAVVLNPRYPEVCPLFSLSLSWKGERSGHTDDNLRV